MQRPPQCRVHGVVPGRARYRLDGGTALATLATRAWVGGLVAWVLGVAWQLQQPALWPDHFYKLLCALSLILIGLTASVLAKKRKRCLNGTWLRRAVLCGGMLAVGALGWGSTGWRAAAWDAQTLPAELESKTLLLTGRVANLPHATALGWRFTFEPDPDGFALDGDGARPGQPVAAPPRVLLSWVNQLGVPAPRSGERWQIAVRLRKPHGLANPHGFDGELWLWGQGVAATGYVRMGRKDPPPHRLAEAGWGLHPARERVRDEIARTLANAAASGSAFTANTGIAPATGIQAERVAGVLAALVVGDQAAIERQDWDVFRITGVAHLMAISGLHITLWAWLVAAVVFRVWRSLPRWAPGWGSRVLLACPAPLAAAWGGGVLALAYAVFSGWGVPAQRTVLMLAVALALRGSGKHWPWPLVMGVALAVVLAWDPWAWLQAGFWLSFVAVGVLLTQQRAPYSGSPESVQPYPVLGRGAKELPKIIVSVSITESGRALKSMWIHVRTLWHTQWVMTLSLAPLTLVLFGQVSVVGFVANLVAIPLVTLVVTPLALLGVVWSGFWLWAGGLLSIGMDGLAAVAAWPLASLAWPAMPWGLGVLAVVGGVVLAMPWPGWVRLVGVVCIVPGLLFTPARPAVGEFEVLAADVGQGSAVLIRTAVGSVLYDAGPQWGLHADAGQRVLRPLLQALGEQPNRVVLSHRDGDHVGGALGVLQGLPDAQVWASLPPSQLVSGLSDPGLVADVMGPSADDDAEPPSPDITGARWPDRLGNRRWSRCEAGQRWEQDGVRFELLHPSPEVYARKTASNNLSCVLWVRGEHTSALLTGDLDAAHEALLVQAYPNLQADWLLAPHHGSKSSSGAGFLAQVQPRWVVAQAGYRNRYGHPAAVVVQRYQALGLRWVTTPDCGAATWQSWQPDALMCQRQVAPRYWQARPRPGSTGSPKG